MNDIVSTVTILSMVKELRDKGSWTGETHIQKAMFFLDKKCKISTDFEFILYKHGPYSFDLHDSLGSLFSVCLVEHEILPPYGPRIRLTKAGEDFLAEHAEQLGVAKAALCSVAGWFGAKGVAELEKLATALWVCTKTPTQDAEVHAMRVHEIKPHISVEEALEALSTVNALPSPA